MTSAATGFPPARAISFTREPHPGPRRRGRPREAVPAQLAESMLAWVADGKPLRRWCALPDSGLRSRPADRHGGLGGEEWRVRRGMSHHQSPCHYRVCGHFRECKKDPRRITEGADFAAAPLSGAAAGRPGMASGCRSPVGHPSPGYSPPGVAKAEDRRPCLSD